MRENHGTTWRIMEAEECEVLSSQPNGSADQGKLENLTASNG
jgi:hypothetical protein